MAKNPGGGSEWASGLVRRVGAEVKARRRGRSAQWLSDRTEELGYRISPTVIAKLDSGHRGEVLSVAEWLILAAALDIPPLLLLYPGLPDGAVEMLPEVERRSAVALRWASGELAEAEAGFVLPEGMKVDRDAQQVMEWTRERIALQSRIAHLKRLIGEVGADAVENLTTEIARHEGRLRVIVDWLEQVGGTVEDGATDA